MNWVISWAETFELGPLAHLSVLATLLAAALVVALMIASWTRRLFSWLAAEMLVQMWEYRFGRIGRVKAAQLERTKQVLRLRAVRSATDQPHWIAVATDVTRDLDHRSFEQRCIAQELGREVARQYNAVRGSADNCRQKRHAIVVGVLRIVDEASASVRAEEPPNSPVAERLPSGGTTPPVA